MKKTKILLCLLMGFLCLALSACNQDKVEDLGEEYIEGSDYQSQFGSMPQIQKVGNGYYFLVSERLYYYDPSMQQAVPVCNKADCDHSAESCNASMSGATEINYYDHKFYYIASENDDMEKWFLYYLSEDGKQREKVTQIATLDSSDKGISFQLCVHRGYAYFSILKGTSLKKRTAVVQKVSLQGDADWTEVAAMEGYGATIDDLAAYGNTLVVTGSY